MVFFFCFQSPVHGVHSEERSSVPVPQRHSPHHSRCRQLYPRRARHCSPQGARIFRFSFLFLIDINLSLVSFLAATCVHFFLVLFSTFLMQSYAHLAARFSYSLFFRLWSFLKKGKKAIPVELYFEFRLRFFINGEVMVISW